MGTGLVRWVLAAALALGLFCGFGSAARAHGPQALCFDAEATGGRTCNCSELAVGVKICHATSVAVTLNARSLGSFSTGQSSSTCYALTLPPEKCVWIRYRFRCCPTFFSWNCTYVGDSIHSAPAGPKDC